MRFLLLICFSLFPVVNCTTGTTLDLDNTTEAVRPFCAKYSLNEHKRIFSGKITDLAYRFKHYQIQLKKLELLVEKISTTSTFDIGGIRQPLFNGIYSIADVSHVTINRAQYSFPDFFHDYGLDFGGFLQQFPEIERIVASRTTPLNCLVSHVGDYIFEDAFQKEGAALQFFRSAPVLMNKSCSIRFDTLHGFIDGLSAYLCLLKGGSFTYKSFKHSFGRIDSSVFSTEKTEDYQCYWEKSSSGTQAHTFQQRILRFSTNGDRITAAKKSGEELNLEDVWTLVGFSHRIFTDILGINGVQTTLNALDEYTLFHTISFLVPDDYAKPTGIKRRLTRLLEAYDAAQEA